MKPSSSFVSFFPKGNRFAICSTVVCNDEDKARKMWALFMTFSDAVGVRSPRRCTAPTPQMGGAIYDTESVIYSNFIFCWLQTESLDG